MPHQALPPFAAWAGSRHPKLLIIGEAWGEAEAQAHEPFVGTSGKELWRMLGEAIPAEPQLRIQADESLNYGITWIKHRHEWLEACGIAFTNVLAFRPPDNDLGRICQPRLQLTGRALAWPALSKGKYLPEEYFGELDRLAAELEAVKPNLVVLAGNTACWSLLRATNIGSIRGTVTLGGEGLDLPNLKALPTYHPAGVLRQWAWRPIVVADLMKAWREAERPELVRPRRWILVNPTLEECQQWVASTLSQTPHLLACDIETGAGQIKCVGFSRNRSESLVIPFVDFGAGKEGSYWRSEAEELSAWECVRKLLESGFPLCFQNGLYDLQYLLRLGFHPRNVREDTMLLHHSLHPELQKGLGFLGSIYTNEASWKLMRRQRPDTEKRDE